MFNILGLVNIKLNILNAKLYFSRMLGLVFAGDLAVVVTLCYQHYLIFCLRVIGC